MKHEDIPAPGSSLPASPFNLEDLLAEARRELLMRQHVYPRLVRQETMPEAQAARQIALQEAIVALLAGLVALEAAQMDLFGQEGR